MLLGFSTGKEAEEWDDDEILRRSQTSPWLFSILVTRYEAAFTRKVRTIIRNPADVEEVVQDTFTKIYVNADKYQPQSGAKFSSWAYRILMNTAFTRYQKLAKENRRFINIDPEQEQLYSEWKENDRSLEDQDCIERILARIPGHLAFVLRLHYLEHWSHQDIAEKPKKTSVPSKPVFTVPKPSSARKRLHERQNHHRHKPGSPKGNPRVKLYEYHGNKNTSQKQVTACNHN
jgi:RNA polymerase sigma factor (sigma-70 family)